MDTTHTAMQEPFIVPWSKNYAARKFSRIREWISAPAILKIFGDRKLLPPGYGIAIDERCIEYPWFFACMESLGREVKNILDAGSALNHEAVIHHPLLNSRNLHIATLAPEGVCFWQKGISYIFTDLRTFPIRDNFYDCIVSISTIEHVGMNNYAHSKKESHRQHRPKDHLLAMQELWRVLRPGGTLLVTVPYGVYTDMGFALQFDRQALRELTDSIDHAYLEKSFYKYSEQGWQIASEENCEQCSYVGWLAEFFADPKKGMPSPIPLEKDRAAAARAVACLQFTKK